MPKKIDKYELKSTLGKGTFSKVKYAVDTETKIPYAIKIIDRQMIEKEKMEKHLKREISIMKILKHKHVIGLKEVLQSKNHIYIVLELVTGGELFDKIGKFINLFIFLVKAKRFSEDVARRYFQQLVSAVDYCHRCGIAHRDLKPENLLLDAEDNVKISDFGLSALTYTRDGNPTLLQTTCGTPNYVAPEVIGEKGYDGYKADVWSCGVILYVMLAGFLPFEDETIKGLFEKIEKGVYRMPSHFSDGAKNIISKMLTVDAKKRISIADILKDSWFNVGFDNQVENPVKISSELEKDLVSKVFLDAQVKDKEKKVNHVEQKTSNVELNGFALFYKLTISQVNILTIIKGEEEAVIKKATVCICKGTVEQVCERLIKELKNMKGNPVLKGNEIKVNIAKEGQVLQMAFHLNQIIGNLSLIEAKRTQGGIMEFNKIYRDLLKKMEDIVLTKDKK